MKGVTVMDENHSSLTGLNKLTNVLIEASFNFSKIGPRLQVKILKKNFLHRPGIEPGPPAWQASILPLNQRCFLKLSFPFRSSDDYTTLLCQ